jgi:uncharacterized protein (DUF2461 family)
MPQAPEAPFAGFPAGTLEFLRELRRHNEREWFLATGGELAGLAATLERAGYSLQGERYARTPSGYEPAPAAAAHWLRHQALFVHQDLPAEQALDGGALLAGCRRHWEALAPLHCWLVDRVQPVP